MTQIYIEQKMTYRNIRDIKGIITANNPLSREIFNQNRMVFVTMFKFLLSKLQYSIRT